MVMGPLLLSVLHRKLYPGPPFTSFTSPKMNEGSYFPLIYTPKRREESPFPLPSCHKHKPQTHFSSLSPQNGTRTPFPIGAHKMALPTKWRRHRPQNGADTAHKMAPPLPPRPLPSVRTRAAQRSTPFCCAMVRPAHAHCARSPDRDVPL